jgi:hypothetical protein
MLEKKYTYQNIAYDCDESALTAYFKKIDGVVCFAQRGVENPYAQIDKENKTVVFNSEIDKENYGQGAEATRIKLCAALNCLARFFADNGFEITTAPLGVITCEKSALDARAGKTSDKICASDLI